MFSNYYVKRLINTCFGFVTLTSPCAQKCCKEKALWENQKKQNHAQVSHSKENKKHIKFLKLLKNANYRKKISKHIERNIYKCTEVFSFP